MTKKQHIEYWLISSNDDWVTLDKDATKITQKKF